MNFMFVNCIKYKKLFFLGNQKHVWYRPVFSPCTPTDYRIISEIGKKKNVLFPHDHFKLFSHFNHLSTYEVTTLKQPKSGLSPTASWRLFQKCKSHFLLTWKQNVVFAQGVHSPQACTRKYVRTVKTKKDALSRPGRARVSSSQTKDKSI